MLRSGWIITTSLLMWAADADWTLDWPQFRGPDSSGVAAGDRLPDRWSQTDNVLWKAEVPGRAWSSPIVAGNRVFLTTVTTQGKMPVAKKGLYFFGEQKQPPKDTYRWYVMCFDLDNGKELWRRLAHEGVPKNPVHIKNSYASETPVTDGERLYVYFGNVGIYCYDLDGKLLWSKPVEPVRTRYNWGSAASPILYGDRLFIVNDNEDQSYLVALDKHTGEQIWRVDRDEKSNWATPFIWKNELRTELVTPGTKRVRSYDLDGRLLWEFGGMSSITIPTPLARFGLLYVCSGYVGDRKRPIFAIRPGGKGDISLKPGEKSNAHIAWFLPRSGPYNPSPIIYGDYLYVLYDRGMLACYDARTGKEIYGRKRLDPSARAFTASPWAYDGKIFCLSEDGDTFVVRAGPQFEVIGKNPLGEMCMATPAISRGRLLIRTDRHLYCIGRQ